MGFITIQLTTIWEMFFHFFSKHRTVANLSFLFGRGNRNEHFSYIRSFKQKVGSTQMCVSVCVCVCVFFIGCCLTFCW